MWDSIRLDFSKSLQLGLVIILCLSAGLSLGQTTKITGKVYDASTKEALPFVNVSFKGNSKIGTTTDIDGKFELESYYATDSLSVSFVGYAPLVKKVKKDVEQVIDFALVTSNIELEEVEIVGSKKDENPAHPIIRNVIANRKINNREKLQAYEYEAYNKVEFDLNNLSEKFMNRKVLKPFSFIFENVDSADGKSYLPVFMTESLSDFYFRKNPKTEREFIKATKVSGIKNESVQQFLGDMYQNVNIYNTYVPVFGKNFVSPVAPLGFVYYRYYLMDSMFVENDWCYQIKFIPKRKQQATFTGDVWVHDTTFAIRRVDVSIAEDANINFVNALRVQQEYKQVEKEVWMLTKDQLMVDFNLTDNTMGIFGRKTSSYKEFVINEPKEDEFYAGANKVIVADDAGDKNEEFWHEMRHDTLSHDEKTIYQMVDTMAKVPQFRTYVDIIQLIFTGYKVWGPVEIGPYFSTYSFNPVEGHRFRLGGRTSNDFSTRLMIEGYGAFGTTDQKFKYSGGFLYFLSKKPRQYISMNYKDDIEQLGLSADAYSTDNVISSFFRRTDEWKLTRIKEFKGIYNREWYDGLSSQIMFRTQKIRPDGDLDFYRFNPQVDRREPVSSISTSELIFYSRWAQGEQFLSGEFERVSLGTKNPVLEAQYTLGLKDVLGGQYDYQKLKVGLNHKFFLGPLGYSKYRIEAGKIWGTLPFPLLQLHQGNETLYYYESAFNTMNFFEFVSDEWVSGAVEHHFDGFFFNRIPLFRRLKWREVLTGKAVIGQLNDKHRAELLLSDDLFSLSPTRPFLEGAAGIENIFKVLRVDVLYRLSYLDNPDIVKVGIRAKLHVDF